MDKLTNRNGILLPDWVSTEHLRRELKTRKLTESILVEQVVHRPDLKRQPAIRNTEWKG